MRRTDSLERPWCWARLKAGREGDDRGWDGWMISLTWWAWVWASFRIWWWTGKPGCSPWGCKELERLNDWTELSIRLAAVTQTIKKSPKHLVLRILETKIIVLAKGLFFGWVITTDLHHFRNWIWEWFKIFSICTFKRTIINPLHFNIATLLGKQLRFSKTSENSGLVSDFLKYVWFLADCKTTRFWCLMLNLICGNEAYDKNTSWPELGK